MNRVDIPYVKVYLDKEEFLKMVMNCPFLDYDDTINSEASLFHYLKYPVSVRKSVSTNKEFDLWMWNYIDEVSKNRGYVKELNDTIAERFE